MCIRDRNTNDDTYLKSFKNFYKDISSRILRLNHFGIFYYCEDFEAEINKFKKVTENTTFNPVSYTHLTLPTSDLV